MRRRSRRHGDRGAVRAGIRSTADSRINNVELPSETTTEQDKKRWGGRGRPETQNTFLELLSQTPGARPSDRGAVVSAGRSTCLIRLTPLML